MKILVIVNDPPYRTERCLKAFRLDLALLDVPKRSQLTFEKQGEDIAKTKPEAAIV